MSFEKSLFITFFAARMHWENHFVIRLLLAFHYWTLCIDDNLVLQPIQAFRTLQTRKTPNFHATKTIFRNFYKTNGYFFWLDYKNKRFLRALYLFLRNSRSMPPVVFFKKINTFLEEHCWETASGTFENVLYYFSAISPFFQKQPLKETPEAVSQMCSSKKVNTFWEKTHSGDCFWNSWNSSPLFSVCSVLLLLTFLADIYQVLFTYCVITVFAIHFDFGESIFVFFILFLLFYFFNDTDFCH